MITAGLKSGGDHGEPGFEEWVGGFCELAATAIMFQQPASESYLP
jgi:hypothetical protein